MRSFKKWCWGLALWAASTPLSAQEGVWRSSARPVEPEATSPRRLSLGLPQAASPRETRVVRAQTGEVPSVPVPPPPPPPPPPGSATPFPGAGAVGPVGLPEETYNCGAVNTNTGIGGFFQRSWDNTKRCVNDVFGSVGGAFQSGPGRQMFQSDHAFDVFSSPVTNPSYSVDPRSLTEFRPIFIWQRTPEANPVFAGGDNFYLNFQGSVAFTERISVTINRLGLAWIEPENGGMAGLKNAFGFTELHLGPKFTLIRNDISNTLLAAGLVFEVPVGGMDVLQSTGNLSLRPYLSFGQNFFRTSYGSINFMNTTGYAFSTDSRRTDFFFTNFHLDYDVGNFKRFYPLIELNWIRYTMNGSVSNLGFEGGDLANFGSAGVAGEGELTLAPGFRFKFTENIQMGLAGQFNLLGGARHLDDFRLTFDLIFRY